MQTLLLTSVVGERTPQINFAWPEPIRAAFDELARHVQKKERWMVAAAAVLLMLEEDDDFVRRVVREVNDAKFGNELAKLVERAKAKGFRRPPQSGEEKPKSKPPYKKNVGRVSPSAEPRAASAPTPAKSSQR